MKRFNQNQPHIFMGDLNTTPDSKAMQFLNGKTEIQGVSTKSQMKDVWLLLHPEPVQVPEDADGRVQPHDPPKDHPSYGFTFNVHSDYLTKRIDFVYLKNPTTPSSSSAVITTAVPKSIDLFGNTRDPYSKQYPSDHYGLLTTFHLHQQHNNNTIYY